MQTTKTSRSRRIVIALLFPLLFLLTACEFKMDFTIHEDDTGAATMVMGIPKDESLGLDTLSCDELAEEMKDAPGGASDYVSMEDVSDDSTLRCKFVTEPQPLSAMNGDGLTIEREGDNFVVEITPDSSMSDPGVLGGGFTFEVAFHFPGEVESVETTVPESDYTVSGNEVVFTDINVFMNETTITAKAKQPGLLGGGASGTDSGSSAVGGSSGSNAIWWIVGIIVVLIVVGVIAYFVMKSKRNNNPTPGQTQPSGYPPAQQGAYPGAQPYAQGGAYPAQPQAQPGAADGAQPYPPAPNHNPGSSPYPQAGGYSPYPASPDSAAPAGGQTYQPPAVGPDSTPMNTAHAEENQQPNTPNESDQSDSSTQWRMEP